MRTLAVGLALLGAGCGNKPAVPIVPLDPESTREVYDVTLVELKRLLQPKPNSTSGINWSERIYLNPVVLLPEADSSNPFYHDSTWLASIVARGLVSGVCGKAPAQACPRDVPIAFTSLSPPWKRGGGDTSYVQGGYTGEAPGQSTYEGVFWVFTLAPDDDGALKVVRKGPPNYVTFESQ